MNTSYRHLNVLEREKLMILLHTGLSQAEIARQMGRHPSTISRELRRHKFDNYSAQCATESYQRHRLHCKAQKKLMNPKYRKLVEDAILKQQDISLWNDDETQAVVDKLNLRPRKCLGWKTHYEVYFSKSLHLV